MHNKCKIFILVYIIILKMYAIYSQSCKKSFTSHTLYRKVHLWNSCCFAGLAVCFIQLLNPLIYGCGTSPIPCMLPSIPSFPSLPWAVSANLTMQWNPREVRVILFNYSTGMAQSALTSYLSHTLTVKVVEILFLYHETMPMLLLSPELQQI